MVEFYQRYKRCLVCKTSYVFDEIDTKYHKETLMTEKFSAVIQALSVRKRKRQEEYLIALLFLAHDGIMQPAVWNQWVREDSKNQILIVQLSDKEVEKSRIIEKCIPLRLPFSVTWCDPSQVSALRFGLDFVLKYSSSVQCIYFLSGSEVPLVSPSELLRMPAVTNICFPLDVPFLLQEEHDMGKQIEILDKNYDSIMAKQGHMASMSLSRPHAKMIVEFDDNKLIAVMKKHKADLDEMLWDWKLLEKLNEIQFLKSDFKGDSKEAKENTFRYIQTELKREIKRIQSQLDQSMVQGWSPCADESLPFWILFLSGADLRTIHSKCITDKFRRGRTPGPLTFDSMETPYWDPVDSKVTSFAKRVEENCESKDRFYFLRKVSPSMSFPKRKMPWYCKWNS